MTQKHKKEAIQSKYYHLQRHIRRAAELGMYQSGQIQILNNSIIQLLRNRMVGEPVDLTALGEETLYCLEYMTIALGLDNRILDGYRAKKLNIVSIDKTERTMLLPIEQDKTFELFADRLRDDYGYQPILGIKYPHQSAPIFLATDLYMTDEGNYSDIGLGFRHASTWRGFAIYALQFYIDAYNGTISLHYNNELYVDEHQGLLYPVEIFPLLQDKEKDIWDVDYHERLKEAGFAIHKGR